MNVNLLQLKQAVAQATPAGTSPRDAATCGVAAYVGYSLPLPTGKVDSPQLWFADNSHALCRQLVSELGEVLVIDADRACTIASGTWFIRYTAAHPEFNIPLGGRLDFFCTVSRADYFTSVSDYDFMTANKDAAIAVASRIQAALATPTP